MEGQLFTLLPSPRSRWKSFLTGWSVQAVSFVSFFIVTSQFHQRFVPQKEYRVTNLVSYEPVVLHEQQPAPRLVPRSKPPLETKTALPPETKPVVEALVVTPQVRTASVRRQAEPEQSAPELKLESKAPVIPNAPISQIVAVGTFGSKSPVLAAAKPSTTVQTGGFGDPNGVPASEHRGSANVNINAKGSPDFPSGIGRGSGTGGANSGPLMMSAFGSPVATSPVRTSSVVKPVITANTPVEITFKPKPDYTEEGRKQRINGEVRLQVLFSADGRVHVVRVVQGLGYGLDEQAVKAAEHIKFKPALHEGQPVDSTAMVHIIFELIS